MARASRSSKKQPAFDPSELQDLIFSPAVGSGVGSHLVGATEDFPALTEAQMGPIVDTTIPITVATTDMTTMVHGVLSTVKLDDLSGEHIITSNELALVNELADLEQGREEVLLDTSVNEVSTISGLGTVAESYLSIVPLDVPIKGTAKEVFLWITEQGNLVPQARVRPIRLAQDVINSAEESVYDTLWNNKTLTDASDASRLVQAGYDYLVKRTQLSKKTIQRIIAKLIDKGFIAIEHHADIYKRTSTVYRVFSYKAVLDRHLQKGRSHVVKIGPGFSYVRPMEDPRRLAITPLERTP